MNKKDLKIVFLGREFGQILKEKLEGAGFHIVDPTSQKADLIVVGFYGKILSKKVLEIPTHGALNVHPSLLPKYRGPTPVQTAILNGETETGVTIIRMDEQIDHGPILASREFSIFNFQFSNGLGRPDTPELTKILWELGGDLLVKTIPQWIAGEIKPREQDHKKASYTKILTKEDGHIDWTKSAEEIERQIRAFTPWPGTFSISRDRRVKMLKGHILKPLAEGASFFAETPGKVFICNKNQLAVQTGSGVFAIDIIQPEGKSAMSSKQFLNGHSEILGGVLK